LKTLKDYVKVLEDKVKDVQDICIDLKCRLEAAEIENSNRLDVLCNFYDSMTPQENSASVEIFNEINQQNDIDHVE
jgi:hypothetical protein